jgi:hypothetical protein
MKLGAWIFGVLAGILLLYLLVGLILPGRWVAQQSATLPGPPSAVYPFLADLQAWAAWTPFPDSGLESFGPPEGVGAGIRWDDQRYGKGEARITAAVENRQVEYRVEIEGGSLTIHGTLFLEPAGGGTRIHWMEEGDFGWNPLMGYAAWGMSQSQGEAMRASLQRLVEAVEADLAPSLQGARSGPGGPVP